MGGDERGVMSRVLVIGAGVVGLWCAYELHRQGDHVIVLERGEPGGSCSSGNAGWIVPSFSGPVPAPGMIMASVRGALRRDGPLFVRPRANVEFLRWMWGFWRHCSARAYQAGLEAVAGLGERTMALYDALEADGVRFEMHRSGVLLAFLTRSGMDQASADLAKMRGRGYEAPRYLGAGEAREVEPHLSRGVVGGILIDQERHVRPESLIAGLAERVRALGVTVRSNVAVVDLSRRGRRVAAAITAEGPWEADQFVIAAGAWSGALARRAGFRLPVQAGKGYSITIVDPAAQLRRPVYLDEARIACSTFHGALRLAGTMELSGLTCDLDQRRVAAMRRAAGRYLVDWQDGREEIAWVGMRPLVPDGLPVIGRVPATDNLYLATGHGMLGMTLAPATAVAIAEVMRRGYASLDLAPFDPARFAHARDRATDPSRAGAS